MANPFWQEQAFRNAQFNARQQGNDQDLNNRLHFYKQGAQLAKQVFSAMRKRPEGRDFYVRAARQRVANVCGANPEARTAMAHGFVQQMEAYGVRSP